jgi:hypothetical protein
MIREMVLASLVRLRRRLILGRLHQDVGRVVDAAVVPRGQVVRLEQPRLSLVTKYVALAIDDPIPQTELPSVEAAAHGAQPKADDGAAVPDPRVVSELPSTQVASTELPGGEHDRQPPAAGSEANAGAGGLTTVAADAPDAAGAGVKRRQPMTRNGTPSRKTPAEAAVADAHDEAKSVHEDQSAVTAADGATATANVRGEPRQREEKPELPAEGAPTQASRPRRSDRRRRAASTHEASKKTKEAKAATTEAVGAQEDERPPLDESIAATAPDISAPSCTIAVWRGNGKARFYGRSFDALGNEVVLAESPPFPYRGNGIPGEDPEAAEAHRQLIELLRRDGWQSSKKGWAWFAVTFTRD